MWSLAGVNNVEIDGIDLTDNNATNPGTMEYGYGLFKLSNTDGAINNTIQNCTIKLKRGNDVAAGASTIADGSTAILVANCLPTTATTAAAPTNATGANTNNKFYNNIIDNCNTGIALMGFAGVSPFSFGDSGNDIGGVALSTGNQILNYGGAGVTATTAVGIRATNQWRRMLPTIRSVIMWLEQITFLS